MGAHYERYEPAAQPANIGEVGQIDDALTHTPQTVMLSRNYVNLVVFAQPLSYDGGDTSVVRISDVPSERCDEAPDRDGDHTSEMVSWLVLEAGSWQVAGGVQLEVGNLSTSATVGQGVSNQWAQVTFATAFSSSPVVLSQVQSEQVADQWLKTRQTSVSATGFQVALEGPESMTQPVAVDEVIGWLAIEAGEGSWNGLGYKAAQTGDEVTNYWHTIVFGTGSGPMPRFLASLGSYDDADNAHLRYRNLSASMVEVRVEEDTTQDSEVGHTSEVVHYLKIAEDGMLTGQAAASEASYYYHNGQRVAMRKDGVLYYLVGDHLGTTSLVLKADGTVHSQARHYPYGEERWRWVAGGGELPTDYRFTGQRAEQSLGLYHMGARFYDGALGRWTSADSIVPEPGNPQAFNRYSYARNSPVRYVDPTGHFEEEQLIDWFGADWRDLFDARWQDLLLMAEFGDVVLYGDNLSAMFVQSDRSGMTMWSMSTLDEFSGRGEVSFLDSVANSTLTGLYRSKMANIEGGRSEGHMEHQFATDARFRQFERIMAWDKNASGSIMLGYEWYRSALTNQNIHMRPRFSGFSAGLVDYAELGLAGAALWGGRKLLQAAAKKGVQALAVNAAGVLGGPAAVVILGAEVYSWTTWDTSFNLYNNGTGLPPVMPVPTP